MSNIDYVKNVQIYKSFDGTTNEFKYNISGFPMNDPPDVCIIKQVNFITNDTSTNMYSVWSDLINDYIVSFITINNYTDEIYNSSVCPNTTIKLNRPIVGDISFKINCISAQKLQPMTEQSVIILNLEFIRYKK